jgi:uncharacterized protein YuzB (UPF0349 family)
MIQAVQPYMDKMMILIDGEILKGDHSFKVVANIAKMEGSSLFNGCIH